MATFLTIDKGRLVADVSTVLDGDPSWVEVTSVEHLAALAGEDGFVVSSSIDFPEEYTSDPAVLALVAALRG
jgi:hypothetical protein